MDTPVSVSIRRRACERNSKNGVDTFGIAETKKPEEEYDQLPFVEDVSEYRGT